MRHPDWEQRFWDLSCRVAEQMACNPAGIIPQDDAKRCVCFASWVVSEFMEVTKTKPPEILNVDIANLLKEFKGAEAQE